MSEQIKEIADIPKDFMKDGTQFMNRCTKRKPCSWLQGAIVADTYSAADKQEFIKISQAVGVGFGAPLQPVSLHSWLMLTVVMGAIGYVVKLSTLYSSIPKRRILT